MKILIPVKNRFNLELMALSHGFVELSPFRWDRATKRLHAVIRTRKDRAFAIEIESEKGCAKGQSLKVKKTAGPRLAKYDLKTLEKQVSWCLRLDDDFMPFRRICSRIKGLEWVKQHGLGAFLRNSDLFEEFAKVLITTNISWKGTIFINNLILEHMGEAVGKDTGAKAFPRAELVASKSEAFLRKKIRLGYRAPFLRELAKRFASGDVDEKAMKDRSRPTDDLAAEIASFNGFGPYSVNSLLISLGRYERLILDSWTRRTIWKRHFKGKKCGDAAIREHYSKWGKWAGLACWFECALDTWFEEELKGRGQGVAKDA